MSPILITPPAGEPVTLAEAKLHLKLDGDAEDALVTTLIAAARLLVEAASGRMLIEQSWRLVLDRWPSGPLRLPLAPVARIAAARVFDAAGHAIAVAPAAFMLEAADPPALWIVEPLPMPGRTRAGIEIDLVAGYGVSGAAVPPPLRQAVLMLVARWHEQRGDHVEPGDACLPGDVAALVAPYRRPRLSA